jgi:beta-phosphoglucomutase
MPVLAVLFDFDGVIADTENVHVAAWERTFAAMGWDVPPEVCARAAEEDDGLFLKSVFADKGIKDGDLAGWVRRKQAITVGMLSAFPRVYPGVKELVGALAGRVELAVVSGTWRENVSTVLRAAGMESAFAKIIAKEDVKRPKPDPLAYRQALAALSMDADEAVALEDSPSGLLSAMNAGVRTIAIGHRREAGNWVGESTYLPGLRPTAAIVEAIGL